MKPNKQTIIIGAGIAGLSLANFLNQHGLDFKVYEAAKELKPKGLGIWLGINAIQVLAKLDLIDEIFEHGLAIEKLILLDKHNKLIKEMPLDTFIKKYKFPIISILRSDLQKILLSKLPPKKIMTDKRLSEIKQFETGVLAKFEDFSEIEGTHLIGADGIHSETRKAIFPKVKLSKKTKICYRGISKSKLIPPEFKNAGVEYWGDGLLFGYSPLPNDLTFWWAIVPNSSKDKNATAINLDITKTFDSFPALVKDIILKTEVKDIIKSNLYDLPYLAKWSNQNICLIGDAAHAMQPNLGQGGSMSIESAYYLSLSLIKANENYTLAFKQFQQKIKWKTYLIKFSSRLLSRLSSIKTSVLNSTLHNIMRISPRFGSTYFLNLIFKLWKKKKF